VRTEVARHRRRGYPRRFAADKLPSKPQGSERDFFLCVVGWDKDADFDVGPGWQVEPLPFPGMEDQAYGRQPRPSNLDKT